MRAGLVLTRNLAEAARDSRPRARRRHRAGLSPLPLGHQLKPASGGRARRPPRGNCSGDVGGARPRPGRAGDGHRRPRDTSVAAISSPTRPAGRIFRAFLFRVVREPLKWAPQPLRRDQRPDVDEYSGPFGSHPAACKEDSSQRRDPGGAVIFLVCLRASMHMLSRAAGCRTRDAMLPKGERGTAGRADFGPGGSKNPARRQQLRCTWRR